MNPIAAIVIGAAYKMMLVEESSSDSETDEESVILVVNNAEQARTVPIRTVNYESLTILNYNDCQFKEHFRMYRGTFENILRIIRPRLSNIHEVGRPTLKPRTQLLAVLWLLSTPDSYRSTADRFNLGKSSLYSCFVRVIDALNDLAPLIIKWPDNEHVQEVKQGFSSSGITDIVGIIDGSYIPIKAPKNNPEVYICRKKFHAITLQGICDHKLKFTNAFVGYPSSVNDYRIFKKSDVYQDFISNNHQFFPNDTFIVGDKAYPLLEWCMKPYSNRGQLTAVEIYFNTQLSRVRSKIERAFALLKGRFRRLKYLDMNRVDLIPATILASCVLHNFCIHNEGIDELLILNGIEHLNINNNVEIENQPAFEEEFAAVKRDRIATNLYRHRQL